MDIEKSLHDSVASGNVETLKNLLQNDPLLLNRVSFIYPDKIPLHVAIMQKHHDVVKEILTHEDSIYAKVLGGQLNSQQSSALHIASAIGDLVTAKLSYVASPDSCFVKDCQGRNPLHLAAVKDNVKVLEYLVQVAPGAAREKVNGGLSLLHLCVKYNHLRALKVLLPANLNETPSVLNGMINATDNDGETVLHLAVRDNQIDTIKYLVGKAKADVNVENSKGQTALDILEPNGPVSDEIRNILKPHSSRKTRPERWLTRKRDAIMVVAILIATMAFQAGVTPPGGVWQDNQRDDPYFPHKAGEAVIASIHPKAYRHFLRCNTVALVSSLSTILLLISGLPFKSRLFMWFLMVIMWLTVTSIAGTYGISILVVTPKKDYKSLFHVMLVAVLVWSCVLSILLFGNTLRLIDSKLKSIGINLPWPRSFVDHIRDSMSGRRGNV